MAESHPFGHGEPEPLREPASLADLFVTFTAVAVQGFGGVLPVAQRVLCQRKRWLTPERFIEVLSIAQVLPGPNIGNLALMVGDRAFGLRGALAAIAGLTAVPLAIMLSVAELYARFAGHPAVAGALRGMGATSAGLIVGTALKLGGSLRASPIGQPACLALGAATFALVALARVPLVFVLLGVGSLACALGWRAVRRASSPERRP
jgi:chromate transporter